MFYWPTPEEGIMYLLTRDTSWGHRSGRDDLPEYAATWHVGTDEYERRRADAEAQMRDGLAARDGAATGGRSFSNGNGPDAYNGPYTGQRSDVISNEDLNPGHWWLM